MNILGISDGVDDASACLIVDGRVVIALAEAQLRDVAPVETFPEMAVAGCLREAGLRPSDLDGIALASRPSYWSARARLALSRPRWAVSALRGQLKSTRRRGHHLLRWLRSHYVSRQWPRIEFIDPVRALAEGSFRASGYDEAAILCLHGCAEWHTDYLGSGTREGFRRYHQSSFPHSFGLFAESVAAFCGFWGFESLERVEGLAETGDPTAHHDIVSDIVSVGSGGGVSLDLSFFSRAAVTNPRRRREPPYAHKLGQTFGRPRSPEADVLPHHRNLAAAAQRVLEERVLAVVEALHHRSASARLVFCGDLARNASLNSRLLRDGPFDDLYVPPAPGARGQAIAAARVMSRSSASKAETPFLGLRFDDGRQRRALETALVSPTSGPVVPGAADLLAAGRAVGWFDGAAEHGVAPLGHRSILCAPRAGSGRERLAKAALRMVPTPPVLTVPLAAADTYVKLPRPCPYGELAVEVRPEHRAVLGAKARVQTVKRDTNPRLAQLLDAVGDRTGLPVLLQTTFGRRGEVPVTTPEEAVACYRALMLDGLVLGENLVIAPAS